MLSEKVSERDRERILLVYDRALQAIEDGFGPFYAMLYDEQGEVISESANSVVKNNNCLQHAEMNTITKACERLGSYDLSSYNLSLYVNAEPCIMCTGGVMWSGIRHIYYGVPSDVVERITGFDEGFKPDWISEFRARGISVIPNIEQSLGERVLQTYVDRGNPIYKPNR